MPPLSVLQQIQEFVALEPEFAEVECNSVHVFKQTYGHNEGVWEDDKSSRIFVFYHSGF
jgi:hypothetical protein